MEARWRGFIGGDSLGCCSYADEADFRSGPYFDDMKAQALENLQAEIARRVAECDEIRAALTE